MLSVKAGGEALLLFAVMFLPGMLAQASPVDPRSFEQIGFHVNLLAVAVPHVLLVVFVSNLRTPGSSARFGWRRPERGDAVALLVGLLALAAAVWTASLAVSLLPDGWEFAPAAVRWRFDRPALLPLVLVSTLAIGYREEIFYRAYLITRAEEAGTDPRMAIGLGALVFATGHLYQGVAGFAVSLAMGLALGAVYHHRRSLHGVALAHGLYNFAVLAASRWTAAGG